MISVNFRRVTRHSRILELEREVEFYILNPPLGEVAQVYALQEMVEVERELAHQVHRFTQRYGRNPFNGEPILRVLKGLQLERNNT